jgi:hypothetical protein
MLELFPHVLLLSLMASTVANFWTLTLVKGMIFGEFGEKLRAHVDYAKNGCGSDGVVRGWSKFLKGLLCPFCTGIWILFIIHVLYFHVFEPGSISIPISIFVFFFGMGLTTFISKVTSVFINQKLKL